MSSDVKMQYSSRRFDHDCFLSIRYKVNDIADSNFRSLCKTSIDNWQVIVFILTMEKLSLSDWAE